MLLTRLALEVVQPHATFELGAGQTLPDLVEPLLEGVEGLLFDEDFVADTVSLVVDPICQPADRKLTWVILGWHDLNALPRHVFDLPSPQLHFLPVNNLNRRLLNRLLVSIQLAITPLSADLVVLARLFLLFVFSMPRFVCVRGFMVRED